MSGFNFEAQESRSLRETFLLNRTLDSTSRLDSPITALQPTPCPHSNNLKMTANFSPALAGFGPGSAFAGFPTPAARPPRRVASSGSFKDDSRSAPPHSFNGPTPIDHQQTPSLGSWESSDRERQHSTSSLHSHGERATGGAGAGNAGLTNGHAHPAGPAHQDRKSVV